MHAFPTHWPKRVVVLRLHDSLRYEIFLWYHVNEFRATGVNSRRYESRPGIMQTLPYTTVNRYRITWRVLLAPGSRVSVYSFHWVITVSIGLCYWFGFGFFTKKPNHFLCVLLSSVIGSKCPFKYKTKLTVGCVLDFFRTFCCMLLAHCGIWAPRDQQSGTSIVLV